MISTNLNLLNSNTQRYIESKREIAYNIVVIISKSVTKAKDKNIYINPGQETRMCYQMFISLCQSKSY